STETPLRASDRVSPEPNDRTNSSPTRAVEPWRAKAGLERGWAHGREKRRPASGTRPSRRAIRDIKRSSASADSRCGGPPGRGRKLRGSFQRAWAVGQGKRPTAPRLRRTDGQRPDQLS